MFVLLFSFFFSSFFLIAGGDTAMGRRRCFGVVFRPGRLMGLQYTVRA